MTQYIDKAAVVAEIEKRVKSKNKDRDFNYLQIKELEALLSFLDTLEVKDVDLEKELKNLIGNVGQCDRKVAKYFFELGLKAKKGE